MQSYASPNIDESYGDVCSVSWLKTKIRPELNRSEEPLYIVDLFCGSGGLTLGAFEACRKLNRLPVIKLAIDLDLDSLRVYEDNFPVDKSAIKPLDIQRLCRRMLKAPKSASEQELKESIGKVHVLLAGPPCQGHSDLNNSTRRNDKRNRLYLHAIRFAQITEPDVILIENVPAVRHDAGQVLKTAISALEALNYYVQDLIVDMSNLGLPQIRKRHILIATKKLCEPFAVSDSKKKRAISCVIDDLVDSVATDAMDIFNEAPKLSAENIKRINYLFEHNLQDLPNKLRPPCHRFKKHSYVSMYGRLSWSRPAQTITSGFGSPGQGRYIHPTRKRLITAHEAARLQGFPDFFSFDSVKKKVKLREMIANAVPPVLAASVLLHVLAREVSKDD